MRTGIARSRSITIRRPTRLPSESRRAWHAFFEQYVFGEHADSIEHILAELERIDLLIQAQVTRSRQVNQENEFQGLYISEKEVDALLEQPIGLPRWATVPTAPSTADRPPDRGSAGPSSMGALDGGVYRGGS